MKPFTKGALISALWWIPAGVVLALVLQAGAFVLLGWLMSSGNAPDWLPGMKLREIKFTSIDTVRSQGTFDYSWSVRTLDGVTVPMQKFRGKTLFFNQWATWCMPCVMEMPSIDRLYRSVNSEAVAFVLVTEEEPQVVRDFLDGKDWDVPVYVVIEVPEGLARESIPYTMIVGPEGTIRFTHGGAADYDSESARKFLTDLSGGEII